MAKSSKTKLNGPPSTRSLESQSPGEMIEIAAALGILAERGSLSDQERDETHSLLHELSNSAETRVRAAVARAIAEYPLLPPVLAQKLAQDVLDVAGPMLELSPVLSDAFLLEQIEKNDTSEECQIRIARRKGLSGAVSGTLLKSGKAIAAETVLSNKTATIEEASLLALLEREDLSGKMVTLVATRDDLSEPLVAQCHQIILTDHFDRKFGHEARTMLIEKYELPPEMASTIVQTALEDALTHATLEACSPEAELELLTEHLNNHGDLTASLILRMLCAGSFDFAKAAFRTLSGQSRDEIAIAFFGAGTDAIANLYRETGLDPYLRFAVTVAIKRMAEEQSKDKRAPSDKPVQDIIREIVGFYRGIAPSSIEQVIASLCHEADRWRKMDSAPAPQSA